MTLEELKRKEKELREKYGDDLYEKLYMQQYNREKATTAPAVEMTKPPAYPAAPKALNPLNQTGKIQPPNASGKLRPGTSDNKIENTFYTSKANSGIMPNNLKSIQDFRGIIGDLDKRIADLNKQQFNTMLTGDGKKTEAFDSLIKNTESIRDSLKEQLARVMGIGSESADKDMLRKGGGNEPAVQNGIAKTPSSRMQFNADEPQQVMGLDGEDDERKEEYPPEPTPSSVPSDPFKEGNKQEDSNILGDIGNAISDAGEWITDKASNIIKRVQDTAGVMVQTSQTVLAVQRAQAAKHAGDDRDPLTEEHVYITEREYKKLSDMLDKELEERYNTSGPVDTAKDINMQKTFLEQNQKWSRKQDEPYILAPRLRQEMKDILSKDKYFKNPKEIEISPELKDKLLKIIYNDSFVNYHSGVEGIENVDIEFCTAYSYYLSNKDAYFFYDGYSDYEEDIDNAVVSTILGRIPGSSQIVKAYELAQGPKYDEQKENLYNTLGGEYTVSPFVYTVQGDFGIGDIGQQYYLGFALYRDNVVLENGEVVEYPNNTVSVYNLNKEQYEYIKIAFGIEE